MDAIQKLEERMGNGEPFTYAQMCAYFASLGGNEEKTRQVDKTIQRWRRNGWAKYERKGRQIVWTAVPGARPEAA